MIYVSSHKTNLKYTCQSGVHLAHAFVNPQLKYRNLIKYCE